MSNHLVGLITCALAAIGCDDLSDFTTAPGEAYCGAITLGAGFRAGLSPRVQMRLRFDASALDDPDRSPGTLTTFEAATSDRGTPERRILLEAPLRPIASMASDPLSRPEFGEGRERNAIFAVSPADPAAEAMLAVISLRSDQVVEVRLLRPGAADPEGATEGRRQVFGLFSLQKKDGACGF